jgi:hypothetical protein
MSRPARYEPSAGALAVVRACLATREDPRAEDWAALGDIRGVLRQPDVRRAGLMPQLLHAATEASVALDPTLRSLCRAARAHEELRIAALTPTCRHAVAATQSGAIVLRGVALGHTVYAHPALRHCHDLDLLVPDGEDASFEDGGFPVSRHRRLFAGEPAHIPWADLLEATIEIQIAGVAARVLEPATSLLDVCVQAATHGPPRSPLWCIDAALLIRSGALDWDRAVSRAREWRIAGHAGTTLSWLRERLGIPVPLDVVQALRPRRWWRPRAYRASFRLRELTQ